MFKNKIYQNNKNITVYSGISNIRRGNFINIDK